MPGTVTASFLKEIESDRNRDRDRARDRERFNFLSNDDSFEEILIRNEDNPFGSGRTFDEGPSIRPGGLLRLIRERGELESLFNSGGNLQIRRSSTAERNEAAYLD